MDIDQSHLLTLSGKVIYGLLGSLGGGAHEDDDPLGVRSAVIAEQVIVPSGKLVDLLHVLLHSGGDGIHLLVAGFAALEEDVGVDGGAASGGMLRIQGVLAKGFEGFHIHERAQVLIVKRLNLLDLV
ncbi:hypothetical protein DSECCO2_510520 [anaerobic digester metagenome]